MTTALFIAWREVKAHRGRAAAAAALVAAATGLCVAVEFISGTREEAVTAAIDGAGPAIRMAPPGVGAAEVARLAPGESVFPIGFGDRVREALARDARVVEERLIVTASVEGGRHPVIGLDPAVAGRTHEVGSPRTGTVFLGKLLSASLGRFPGDRVNVDGRELPVSAVTGERGSVEDLALYVPIGDLRAMRARPGASNELRVFLKAGVDSSAVATRLRARFPGVTVWRADRAGATERDISSTLAHSRRFLYTIAVVGTAMALFASAFLNARERELELALLSAIGATGRALIVTLCARMGLIGLMGALAGCALGAFLAHVWDPAVALGVVYGGRVVTAASALGAGVGILSGLPVAVRSALKSPVAIMQRA